ncbi:MAG: hypothetical protein JW902_18240 [Syntrophaceae bacterium]|nr:hypothetical protein [Syntrophaceae bacterium]
MNVLKLVIQLDIPNSTEALLDSAALGDGVQEALAERLIEEGKENTKILLSLQGKFTSSDIFYKGNRSAYLRIINKYLQNEPLMDDQKREIVKDIVVDGLVSEDRFVQQYAIRSSKYFPGDMQILEELQRIATTDTHSRLKDGVKTFPLREEAQEVLQEIQRTR